MSDLLSEIEERLANATPGPWDWVPSAVEGGSHVLGVVGESGFPVLRTSPYAPPRQRDADLIAHAPADLAALVAVVREVAALHRRRVERPNAGCLQCGQIWPCPTAAAVQQLGEGS
jgi:hypothetical protein